MVASVGNEQPPLEVSLHCVLVLVLLYEAPLDADCLALQVSTKFHNMVETEGTFQTKLNKGPNFKLIHHV